MFFRRQRKAIISHHCSLFIFILAILLCAASAVSAADGIHASGGGFNHVPEGTAISTTAGSDPGLKSENPGTIISADDSIVIKTTGIDSYGAFANNRGVILIGSSADISTTGSDAAGAYADRYSTMKIGGYASIATSGDNAHGAYAWNSSMDIGDCATIDTTGHNAFGIVAYGTSNTDVGSHVTITTSGGYAHGAYAWSKGNLDLGGYATIVTSGEYADGISSFASSRLDIGDHATITTSGDRARGAFVSDKSSMDIGDYAAITTAGYLAHGAYAWSDTSLDIGDYAAITTTGDNAYGIHARIRSDLNIGDYAAIATSGDNAYGAYAQQNSRIDIGGQAVIITSGDSARGAFSYDGSYIDIGDQVTIITSGDSARGAQAGQSSYMAIGDYATIITNGAWAYGAQANSSSSMDIGDHATIITARNDAYGTHANNSSSMDIGDYATIATIGERAHAVFANGNSSILLRNAAISASGTDAYAVHALSDSRVTGSGVYSIAGDMYADIGSGSSASIDLTLESGSLFTGAASISGTGAEINLAINGDSAWNVTGDSSLTSLSLSGSAVNFTGAAPGATLTMESLSGTGTFAMKTDISSLTCDWLEITAASAGSYTIGITDSSGGAASQNDRLTLVEDADGTARFALAGGYANLGLWRYGLESVAMAGGGVSWQLFSQHLVSDQASAAINTFRGALLLGYAETQTLIQRMGDLRSSPHLSGVWFRVHGGKFEADAGSFTHGFDMDYGGVQIGFDRKFGKWNGDLYLGAMFGYTDGDLDFDHVRGDGSIESRTLGVYGTYIKPDGFYIDAVLKYRWTDSKFNTVEQLGDVVSAPSASTDGFGMSLEAGKRFKVGEVKNGGGWYVEPQAQLSYQHYDGAAFRTNTGFSLHVDDFKSLTGRIGALVGYQTEKADFYAKVSVVKEFDGDMTIRSGASSLEEDFGDEWFVYGIGFTSRVNDRNSLHLEVERTSGGDFTQPWRVTAGWRIEF